jgi:Major capsid protein Gp23
MANLVQSLLNESAQTAYSDQFSVASKLTKKWAKSGLLEGLSDHDRSSMAVILENQAKQLVIESSQTGNGLASGGATWTNGSGGEQWAGVALPLVRKIFGQIAAKEFVSVQPMNLPAGLVFFLDFQYGTAGNPHFPQGTSVYGAPTANFGNAASGGLYEAGQFGYSLNLFSASLSSSNGQFISSSARWADVNFDATVSASIVSSNITKLSVPLSFLSGSDANAVRSFSVLPATANGIQFTDAEVLQNFTALSSSAAGTYVNFYVLKANGIATPGANANFTYYYSKATDFNARGDFEDRTSTQGISVPNAYSPSSIQIPEINVGMRSETISAKTRKLKAQWTPEFAQDLNAYHALDAEAELTGLLSEHVSLEIDLEVMDMLMTNAASTEYWSAKVGTTLTTDATTGVTTYNAATTTTAVGQYYTQMTWFQTLGIKLQKVSNLIHQRTLRGGANFMVVSPTVATILESIPGFAADTDGAADTMKYAFGVQKIGALNSRYKVYKNPYMTENVILMGFRGTQFLECGAVYAPYVPLIMTPLVYDPNTFTPRKGIMTRYALKMVRPEFYGKVIIADTNVI